MPAAWGRPSQWALLGAGIWAPVAVFLGVWGQLRNGADWLLPWGEAVVTMGVLMGARWVAAASYRYWYGDAQPNTGGIGSSVRLRPLLIPMTFSALSFGMFVGTLGNLWGWGVVIPGHWVLLPALLAAGAWIYGSGSVLLYNGIVLPWCADRAGLPSRRLHRALALTGFVWVLAVSTLGAVVGGTLLFILAHRWPAGWFGVEVAIFAWAAVVFVGFWISYGLGWWYALIVMHAWHARVRQLA